MARIKGRKTMSDDKEMSPSCPKCGYFLKEVSIHLKKKQGNSHKCSRCKTYVFNKFPEKEYRDGREGFRIDFSIWSASSES